MHLDLDLGPDEVAIQDAVARFCDHHLGKDAKARRAARFSRNLWRDFAELGVIDASRDGGSGGMLLACVAIEVLGQAAFPGPVVQTIAAAGALSDADWPTVATGERLVAFGPGPILAWGAEADILLVCDGRHITQFEGPCEGVATLADTQSGRRPTSPVGARGTPLCAAGPALARYDMATAAFVQAAGRAAVECAADHARTRRQFGKAIGEFQAVAFPLAEALMGLNAARIMTRFAAMAIDQNRSDARALATAARISATRSALRGCYAAHQTFGAAGQLTDGPVAWLSRPVQELAVQNRGLKALRAGLPLTVVSALDLDAWSH